MSDISLAEVNAEIGRRKQLEDVNAEIKRRKTSSNSGTPAPKQFRSKEEARAQNAANIQASMQNQGITPQAVRKVGIAAAKEQATSSHENAQSRALHDAAQQALVTAHTYQTHGGGMGDDDAQQAREHAATQQAQARLNSIRPDAGTLLNQIQPGFDHALAQQQGKRGAVYDKAAQVLNSIPDLAALAAGEGALEIPAIAGQSLVTRGFQAQQVAGLAREAGNSDLRKTDPGKYYTSLLLGGLLAGAPDIVSHAKTGLTKAVDAKAKPDTASAPKTGEYTSPRVKAKPKAPTPTAEPPKTGITPEQVKAHAKDGSTKAADLFAAAKKANPKLTREEFAQQLYEFHKGDTHNYEGPSGNAKPADVFTAKDNNGKPIRYYGFSEKTGKPAPVETKIETPVKTNETVETKPEVKPTEPQPSTEKPNSSPEPATAFKPYEPKSPPAQGHNTTNEMVGRARESMGIPRREAPEPHTWKAVADEIEKRGLYHPEKTKAVAERILRGGHAMSEEELLANNYRQHMIMQETSDLRNQIDEGIKAGNNVTSDRVKLAFLEDEFKTLTDATDRTGTLSSRVLNIRKATLPKYDHNVVMQRLAHAKPGVEPTEAEKKEVGEAAKVARVARKKATDAKTKSDPADDLRSKHAAAEAVREMNKTRRQGVKKDLDTQLKTHLEKMVKILSRTNSGLPGAIDPAIIPVLKDIAVNRLSVAKLTAEQLVDQVHAAIESHAELKGKFTKRQVQDGLSGYGQDPQAAKRSHFADLKEEMKLLSEIEDTKAGVERERKIRTARQPTPEVARLRKERADLKAANKPSKPARAPKPAPKSELERRLDNQKARLGKQIEDMDKRIKEGDFSKDPKRPAPTDPELESLKARRDSLKRVYDSLDPATEAKARAREARGAERETAAEARKQRASDIRDKRKQIFAIENDLRGLDKKSPWDVKETVQMRADLNKQLQQANAELDAMTTGPHRTADPLTAYKLKKQAEIDALDKQLANGKADQPKPEPFKLNRDRAAEALDAEARRKEDAVDNLIKKREGKDWQDKLIAYRRFAVLSRVGTLAKLGAAASERMIFSPLEEVTGLPAQLLTGRNVARNAPTQGGFSMRAEMAAGNKFFTRQTWTKDAVDKLMTGKHDLDARLGKNEFHDEGEKLGVLNFMGRLHGAIKTPAQLAAFERAQVKGTAWAERQGLDVNDPNVQAHVDAMAYQEGLRAILMQDNVAVGMYKGVINSLERYDHPAGKATATLMKAAMPIVKVPTNFAGEVGLHVAGGLRAGWEVAGAKLAGRDLSPEQCDIVLRSLKKQGVGGMMFALGYFNADKMGGTYVPGDKPRAQEYGSIKIGGWTVPHEFLHNPAIEAAQLGATFARTHSAYDVGFGATESIPMFELPKLIGEVYGGDKKAGQAIGKEVGGGIFPGIMNEIGGNFNKDTQGKQIKRKPQAFLDEMKMAAGLQHFVPTSSPSSRGGSLSSATRAPSATPRMSGRSSLHLANP